MNNKQLENRVRELEIELKNLKSQKREDYIFSNTRKTTGQNLAEQALKESEEKFRLLSENVTDGVVLFEDNKVKYISQGNLNMLGYEKHEIENISFEQIFSFVHNDDIKRIKESIESAHLNKTNKFQYIYIIINKKGDYLWVEDSIDAEYDRFGNHFRSIIHSRDITQRIKDEAEIRLQNELLLKLNAEKDKFFSIIAHDLRSPFSGFLGLTQIMAEDLHSFTMDEIKEIAVNLRNSAANLFRLLENLLHWARIQQGLIPFNPEVLPLLTIVSESVDMILESARSKVIEIDYDIPDDLIVLADCNILQTIIRNLVSNAIKFTHKGGNISISAKVADGNSVEIEIKDTGIGISKNMIEKLFRLDAQNGRRGTEGELTTGLGLMLCKEFVEKHGGRLWVESTEGKGSKFYFSLPTKSW